MNEACDIGKKVTLKKLLNLRIVNQKEKMVYLVI